ncbi:hypothetical protein C5167_023743 [Papaver somniferum]|uniref:Uncharacterized protein n=1 Tax=Papaver somniferum TaxID=3469 RepID=A0A4Y7JQI8_PAPSO|nr:hypothetical protein C5167_023743 [Papaver somniferum]
MGADSELHQEIITLVESKLGEPLREDGPILGMEFDPLLLGAFGAPTVSNVKVGGGGGRSTVSMGGPSLV